MTVPVRVSGPTCAATVTPQRKTVKSAGSRAGGSTFWISRNWPNGPPSPARRKGKRNGCARSMPRFGTGAAVKSLASKSFASPAVGSHRVSSSFGSRKASAGTALRNRRTPPSPAVRGSSV